MYKTVEVISRSFEPKVLPDDWKKRAYNVSALLYPLFIMRFQLEIKRMGLSPRVIPVFVSTDAARGVGFLCDSIPPTESMEAEASCVLECRVSEQEAVRVGEQVVLRHFLRKYLSFWEPSIVLKEIKFLYKIIWVVSEKASSEQIFIDSISGKLIGSLKRQ